MIGSSIAEANGVTEFTSFFSAVRDYIVKETFGGPNTYALLKERNPQIDLILNAGIAAGLQFRGEDPKTAH